MSYNIVESLVPRCDAVLLLVLGVHVSVILAGLPARSRQNIGLNIGLNIELA